MRAISNHVLVLSDGSLARHKPGKNPRKVAQVTDSRDNWLTFGYNTGLVRDLRAAWGARWIVTQDGGVDQLYDRQSAFGDQDRVEKLFQWLDSGANKRAREIASRMLSEYKIRPARPGP